MLKGSAHANVQKLNRLVMLMKNIHVRLLIGRDFMYASIMAESVLNSSLERTSGKIIIVATVGIMRSHLNCKNVFSISPPISANEETMSIAMST